MTAFQGVSDYYGSGTSEGDDRRSTFVRLKESHQLRAFTPIALVVAVVIGIILLNGRPKAISVDDWDGVQLVLQIVLAVVIGGWLWLVVRAAFGWSPPARATSYLYPGMPIADQLLVEALAMSQYCLKQGISIDAKDIDVLNTQLSQHGPWTPDTAALVNGVHQRLATKLKPASPHTIALLVGQQDRPLPLSWLGNVRLVRMLVGLSTLLLPAFVLLAISAGSSIEDVSELFTGRPFGDRLLSAIYLLVAAALGAAFAALRRAFRYIGNLSYDEKFESSYWIRFVQGLMAGLILSVLLSAALFGDGSDAATDTTEFRISLPLLAFVGGFSEDLVLKILRRVVEAIGTLVTGTVDDRIEKEAALRESEAQLREAASSQALITKLLEVKTVVPPENTVAQTRIDTAIANVLGTEPVADDQPEDTENPAADPNAPEDPVAPPDPPEPPPG